MSSLHHASLQLARKCEEVLIQTYLHRFYDEFDGLLRNDRDSDVARMYSLVARLPSGLEQMKLVFDAHVLQRGTTAIDKCQDAAANVSGMVARGNNL